MPFNQVMPKFKLGQLSSGSKNGPKVKNRKQAIAIMLSEKKKAGQGKSDYQPLVNAYSPSKNKNNFKK